MDNRLESTEVNTLSMVTRRGQSMVRPIACTIRPTSENMLVSQVLHWIGSSSRRCTGSFRASFPRASSCWLAG